MLVCKVRRVYEVFGDGKIKIPIREGAPDSNDWIDDCVAQADVYTFIIETLDLLSGLIE